MAAATRLLGQSRSVIGPDVDNLLPDSEDLTLAQDLGTAIHAVIAWVAAKRGGAGAREDVWEAARALDPGRLAPVYRQSARQRVATAAATYFRCFGRPDWRFEGPERVIGDVALDLLWSRRGQLEADEIKTGLAAQAISLDAVRRQVEFQASAGAAELGAPFRGVRAVLLAGRPQSFFVRATTQGGTR